MRITRVFCLLVCVGGCQPPSGIDARAEVYVLRSLAGQSLPAPLNSNSASSSRIIADTLAFSEAGVGEHRGAYEAPGTGLWTVRTAFTYVRTGDRVEISLRCDDSASCIAPPHYVGTFTSTELLIDQSNILPVPMRFERATR
jgi:hypothetical protein